MYPVKVIGAVIALMCCCVFVVMVSIIVVDRFFISDNTPRMVPLYAEG